MCFFFIIVAEMHTLYPDLIYPLMHTNPTNTLSLSKEWKENKVQVARFSPPFSFCRFFQITDWLVQEKEMSRKEYDLVTWLFMALKTPLLSFLDLKQVVDITCWPCSDFDYHKPSWVSHNSELTEHHDDVHKRWQQGSKARVRHSSSGFSVLVKVPLYHQTLGRERQAQR